MVKSGARVRIALSILRFSPSGTKFSSSLYLKKYFFAPSILKPCLVPEAVINHFETTNIEDFLCLVGSMCVLSHGLLALLHSSPEGFRRRLERQAGNVQPHAQVECFPGVFC